MFNSFFESLRNRRNGSEQKEQPLTNALSVEIKITLPPSAPRSLGPALQQAISDAVLRTVQEQLMSPRSRRPFESPFSRSRRSPFNSPFGDDNEDDDTDALAAILAMAMMAREAEENGNRRSPFGTPFGPDLSGIFRDQADRMNPNGNEENPNDPTKDLTKELAKSIVRDYHDEDYSNPLASAAFAALALVRDEYETLSAPQISQEDVEKALELVAKFEEGIEHCCGLPICPEELTLQVLAVHKEQSITPDEVIAAYQTGDLSNTHARLAMAALAVRDDNFAVLYDGEKVDFRTRMAARELVENYDNEQRYCDECYGEEGCKVQLAYDTLVAYQIMKDEEACWAEHDGVAEGTNETEPVMADTTEGNEEVFGANAA